MIVERRIKAPLPRDRVRLGLNLLSETTLRGVDPALHSLLIYA